MLQNDDGRREKWDRRENRIEGGTSLGGSEIEGGGLVLGESGIREKMAWGRVEVTERVIKIEFTIMHPQCLHECLRAMGHYKE